METDTDIEVIPADGLVPPEQIQQWKDHNEYEMKLFEGLIFPHYCQSRDATADPEGLRKGLNDLFEKIPRDAYWKIHLIDDLKEWVLSSRSDSNFAEPLFKVVEEFILTL